MGAADRATRPDPQPRSADHSVGKLPPGRKVGRRQLVAISPLFGFVQIELAGPLPLDDGRYLVRAGPAERVLVIETEGALPPARRRRRRPRKAVKDDSPLTVTVSIATVVRADQPFASETEANEWLNGVGEPDFTGELLDDAIDALDRARAADAAASGIAFGTRTALESVLASRIGFGDGDRVASGRFLEALEVDARGGTGGLRRERAARTRPLARTAAILGDRENAAACELLVPRIRLDLDTGNPAAAFLAIAPAVEATIAELEFAIEDEEHEKDLDRLEDLLPGLGEVTERAAANDADPADRPIVEEALAVAERVIRRRRILDQ